jgi:hypothetical protein
MYTKRKGKKRKEGKKKIERIHHCAKSQSPDISCGLSNLQHPSKPE